MELKTRLTIICLIISALAGGCTRRDRGELGTEKNPIKFFLLPSVENEVLEASGRAMKEYLEANTKYKFKVSVPTSYIAVVEAFGSKRADMASLNTFGYALAYRKYKAEARLTVIRNGESTYRSAIIAHVKSGITKLEDIDGKRMAYVDPTSTSGYVLPLELFKQKGIKPKQTVFAQRHDNVISMLYQGQVDAGAIYYSPPQNGELQDARRLVRTQYPDVAEKIKIIHLTDSIPNDAIVFRKDVPEEIKKTVSQGLINYIGTKEGKVALEYSLTVTGFKPTNDEEYAKARKMFDDLEKEATKP